MTTFPAVADAIAAELAARWPDRMVYRDVCPADFQRPSFFLENRKLTPERQNAGLTAYTAEWLLTVFDEMDEYYEASFERLSEQQTQVLALFSRGYLRVGGRAVTLMISAEGRTPGDAYLHIQAEWMDAAYADADREDAPLMEDLALNRTIEED